MARPEIRDCYEDLIEVQCDCLAWVKINDWVNPCTKCFREYDQAGRKLAPSMSISQDTVESIAVLMGAC